MKKIFHFEKHLKIYRKFCELSAVFEKISTKKIKNCQNSNDKLLKKIE